MDIGSESSDVDEYDSEDLAAIDSEASDVDKENGYIIGLVAEDDDDESDYSPSEEDGHSAMYQSIDRGAEDHDDLIHMSLPDSDDDQADAARAERNIKKAIGTINMKVHNTRSRKK